MEIISLIIESLGVLATAAAVVVAMVANNKATQSLKHSLEIQEQSKNVDLFDKRVDIISEIENNSQTDELTLELLFNDNIVSVYNELQQLISAHSSAEIELGVYKNTMCIPDGEGSYTSPIAELDDYRHRALDIDSTPEVEREYEEKCNQYQISLFDDVEGRVKIYNHKKLSDDIDRTRYNVTVCKQNLLTLMQNFIKKSISPIINKK